MNKDASFLSARPFVRQSDLRSDCAPLAKRFECEHTAKITTSAPARRTYNLIYQQFSLLFRVFLFDSSYFVLLLHYCAFLPY